MVNDKPSYLIVNKIVMVIIAAKSVSLRVLNSAGFIEMPQYEVHGRYPHKGKST